MLTITGKSALLARNLNGLLRTQVADLAIVAVSTIWNYERGRPVKASTRRRIQKAFEKLGVVFVAGGVRLPGEDVVRFAAPDDVPSYSAEFLPKKDGRIVVLHPHRIGAARREAGMTLEEVASAVGVTPETVQGWECPGGGRLRPENADRLYAVLRARGGVISTVL